VFHVSYETINKYFYSKSAALGYAQQVVAFVVQCVCVCVNVSINCK